LAKIAVSAANTADSTAQTCHDDSVSGFMDGLSNSTGRHMWTAPIGKLFFDVTNDLVSFSHMSGLLVRHDGRWP
jgi:hypothetical protein